MTLRKTLPAILCAAIISSGAVIAAFMDCGVQLGYAILLPVIPVTVILAGAAWLNQTLSVKRYLLNGRYVRYAAVSMMLAFIVSLTGILAEHALRVHMNLPPRISDYRSAWILVDCLSANVLIFGLFGGISLAALYDRWKSQTRDIEKAEIELERRVDRLKSRLDLSRLSASLNDIVSAMSVSPLVANEKIRELSSFLRKQLYDHDDNPADEAGTVYSRPETEGAGIAAFISEPRYRARRHIVLQLFLLLIAVGTMFDAPDRPVFTAQRCLAGLGLLAVLNLIVYGNTMLLFPAFLNRGKKRLYAWAVAGFMAALCPVIIIVQTTTYDPAPYVHEIPLPIQCLSTGASLLTLALFIEGTAAIISLQKWLAGRKRLAELNAETARTELESLRKQINPHFLFNVLNNAGILVYDDPAEAVDMLTKLEHLLDYQLGQTRKTSTTVGAEVSFLTDYLALEQSRRNSLEIKIECNESLNSLSIPTLLFIPFVENAVKYSSKNNGTIGIDFSLDGNRLTFRCTNTVAPSQHTPRQGGIGIANTRKRLWLMYGDKATLAIDAATDSFTVNLTIPI